MLTTPNGKSCIRRFRGTSSEADRQSSAVIIASSSLARRCDRRIHHDLGVYGKGSAIELRPVKSRVRPALCRGLVKPRLCLTARSRSPSSRASFSPCSVSGMSVRPVCWPESDHAVSPWRNEVKAREHDGHRFMTSIRWLLSTSFADGCRVRMANSPGSSWRRTHSLT